jgi:hypothetical protein
VTAPAAAIILTRHGRQRIGERAGVTGHGADRLAEHALALGLTHAEATGPLRRKLDHLYLEHRGASVFRVYADRVWVFVDRRLITVINLDQSLRRIAQKLLARKREVGE